MRQVGGFLQALPISSTNKTNRHDITEILLKVALNTITLTLFLYNTNCIRPLTPKWLLIELGSLFTRSMSAILQQFLYISVWGLKEVFFIISTYIYIYIYLIILLCLVTITTQRINKYLKIKKVETRVYCF